MHIRSLSVPSLFPALGFLALLTACTPQPPQVRTVEVSGSGEVRALADQVTGRILIQTQDKNARTSRDANNTSAQAVLALLEKNGLPKTDIEQTGLSQYLAGDQGYTSSNQIQFKLRDLEAYPSLMDALGVIPHVLVQEPQRGSSTPQAHQAEARVRALKNARQTAEAMAAAYGMRLGPAIRITDGGQPVPMPMAMAMRMDKTEGTPSIDQGQLTFSASVQVVFELK